MNKQLHYSFLDKSKSVNSPSNRFTLESPPDEDIKLQELIKQHVKTHNYIELKSDYLGTDSYYYDEVNQIMYKVSNTCLHAGNVQPHFIVSNDRHILKLNSLI